MRNILIIVIVSLFVNLVTNSLAYRIGSPSKFSLPWTKEQINNLNDYLEKIWNLQNGEFNFDIVTTTKSGAANGDIWLIYTAPTTYLQYKSNNIIYTLRP